MEKFEITRFYSDKEENVVDLITKEVPLTIYVNDREIVTLLASPDDHSELAVGFLFTSGFISSMDEIEKISENTQRWTISIKIPDSQLDTDAVFRRIYTPGCGGGTIFYKAVDLFNRDKPIKNIKIHRDDIFRLMADFQTRSDIFKATGAVHTAALAEPGNILVVREDIGRHNTIDKILGFALMNNMDLSDKLILSSGRISSEILFKIQKTKIGMLVSRGAPTDQAIKHAQDSGIALIGFVRGRRMNVYTGVQQVL